MDALQQDLDRNMPSSEINILAINEVGEDSANALAASVADLPLLQDTNSEDAWGRWDAVWRDVQIVDSDGEVTETLNLTTNDIRQTSNYDRLRQMIVDAAASKRTAGSAHQNVVEPLDTTKDGFVAPNDVLAVINKINRDGAGQLSAPNGEPTVAYDVNGDNFVSALDALRIIQVLNRLSAGSGEPAGEPESVQAPAEETVAADYLFAMDFANSVEDDDDDADEE